MLNRLGCSIVTIMILLSLLVIILIATGCDTFKPIKGESLSEYPECIVMLNTGEIYKGDKDKSGTVSPVISCLDSIKRQRCAMEVFNKKILCGKKEIYVVDWDDTTKMPKFNACLLSK